MLSPLYVVCLGDCSMMFSLSRFFLFVSEGGLLNIDRCDTVAVFLGCHGRVFSGAFRAASYGKRFFPPFRKRFPHE